MSERGERMSGEGANERGVQASGECERAVGGSE